MSNLPQVVPVAELRENFVNRINDLTNDAAAMAQAAQQAGQRLWQRPAGFAGDLFDLSAIGTPFSRADNAQDFQDAIKDPAAPGTVGDLQASQLQGEYLAAMERAYRARHLSPVRRSLHAAARRAGHGHPAGVLQVGVLGYIQGILQASQDLPGPEPTVATS